MGKRIQMTEPVKVGRAAKDETASFSARQASLCKAAGFTQIELASEPIDEIFAFIERGQLWRRSESRT